MGSSGREARGSGFFAVRVTGFSLGEMVVWVRRGVWCDGVAGLVGDGESDERRGCFVLGGERETAGVGGERERPSEWEERERYRRRRERKREEREKFFKF